MTNIDIQTEYFSLPDAACRPLPVLRLDNLHPLVSGNKFFKLQPWVDKALASRSALLSCGGAWSNHLHALAGAGQMHQLQVHAVVRGFEAHNPTPTMIDCMAMGMQVSAVSRELYRQRYAPGFIRAQINRLGCQAIWIPEGGTDEEAVLSCEQIGHHLNQSHAMTGEFDSVWLAVGSGGTLAGLARSLNPQIKLYGVPVMSQWLDVKKRVEQLLTTEQAESIHWIDGASYGGFGRMNSAYREFFKRLDQSSGVVFDPVYTGKLVMRLAQFMLADDNAGERPLVVHTGGLQGRRSLLEG